MSFKRKVGEFNLQDELEREFESVTKAARGIGYSERYVRESCNGKRYIGDKYYRYLDSDGKPIIPDNGEQFLNCKDFETKTRLILDFGIITKKQELRIKQLLSVDPGITYKSESLLLEDSLIHEVIDTIEDVDDVLKEI